ncbi:hypothetical protein DL240_01700 [Lujinxingia litoralis]|uniref:Outer membrane protein beta-barrel domain-containing protein n=1 Tax=Lujinxingia litoralis TaxID=2211119 RepID=A0A328CBK7_9DELT|nr:hypothetical protein [Lujinxingia litoralis]RAL24950.1 hypothetical protein DL240_01700 [Lujinxingia litoralis]
MTRGYTYNGLLVALMLALVASAAPAVAQEDASAGENSPESTELAQEESSEDAATEGDQADADAEDGEEEADEEAIEDEQAEADAEEEATEDEQAEADAEEEATDDEQAEADAEEEDEEKEDPFAEADKLLGVSEDDEDVDFDGPFETTVGGRLELGLFFTDYERLNDYVLAPNNQELIDGNVAQHIDLAIEAMVVRNLRVSVLGGAAFNYQGDPSVSSWYVGLEPAYAVGNRTWEMAVGLSAMFGGQQLSVGEHEMDTSLTVLRPFFEVSRHFPDAYSAVYLRAGFNQWHVYNPRSETLDLEIQRGEELDSFWLSDGGFYLAIGGRFGKLVQPEE